MGLNRQGLYTESMTERSLRSVELTKVDLLEAEPDRSIDPIRLQLRSADQCFKCFSVAPLLSK